MSRAVFNPLHTNNILDLIEDRWISSFDGATKIWAEQTIGEHTIRVDIGGGTPITNALTINQTNGFVWNNGQADVNVRFAGVTQANVLFIDAGNNSLGLGTNDPNYIREGGARSTNFGSLKQDTATSNAGFFALASTSGQRAVDIEFPKCSGTWTSKGTVGNGDIILNLAGLGHDGTDFNRSAVLQVFVDGVVSNNTVPLGWAIQTSPTNGGGLVNRMRVRANGVVQLGGPLATPSITFDAVTGATVFNEQGNTAGDLRVESVSNTRHFFLDASADSIGINNSSPSGAWMHFGAGTTTFAPFKYTAGTNLTTPVNGSKEYDGSNEFITVGGARYILAKTLTATATLDFPSIASNGYEDLTMTVTGAADGDVVAIGSPNGSTPGGVMYHAWVSATNTVTVRAHNTSGGAVNPDSGTFRVSVIKY